MKKRFGKYFLLKSRNFFIFFFALLAFGGWKVHQFQQPVQASDVPEWQVRENEDGVWDVFFVDDPERKTQAWIEGNGDGKKCDTLVILGGLEEGQNLATGAKHLPEQGNIVALRHPINQFFSANPWQGWGWQEWLETPWLLKDEMLHTLGALKAVAEHVNASEREDHRFTDRVILGGGSFGGPFPVIVTSFQPDKVAGLLVIYGFTNFERVISNELSRQGLIHFDLVEEYEWWSEPILSLQALGVKVLGRSLGFLLGNMFKYGYMEYYFPNTGNTPTYFINGKNDHLVPREAYDPMWESVSGPKTEVWVEGDHIRPGDPEEVKKLIDHLHQWAETQDLWVCQ